MMEKEPFPVQAVPTLDLARYVGRWYEIARLPTRFEDDCTRNVTATYSLREDREIDVLNECLTANDDIRRAKGTARLAHKEGTSSQLQVSFVTAFLHFLPFVWADYWVIALDPEYGWAVVGEPGRQYLWVLSRTPQMDAPAYIDILKQITAQGYDASLLIRTQQHY